MIQCSRTDCRFGQHTLPFILGLENSYVVVYDLFRTLQWAVPSIRGNCWGVWYGGLHPLNVCGEHRSGSTTPSPFLGINLNHRIAFIIVTRAITSMSSAPILRPTTCSSSTEKSQPITRLNSNHYGEISVKTKLVSSV